MTKEQRQIATTQIIMLNKKDVREITGWCENVINNTFAYDKDFPCIKKREKVSDRARCI